MGQYTMYNPYNVVLPCPHSSVLSPQSHSTQQPNFGPFVVSGVLAADWGLWRFKVVIYLHYTIGGVPVILVTTGNCSSHQNISYNSGQKLQQVNSYLLVEVLHGPFSGGGSIAAFDTIRIIWYF